MTMAMLIITWFFPESPDFSYKLSRCLLSTSQAYSCMLCVYVQLVQDHSYYPFRSLQVGVCTFLSHVVVNIEGSLFSPCGRGGSRAMECSKTRYPCQRSEECCSYTRDVCQWTLQGPPGPLCQASSQVWLLSRQEGGEATDSNHTRLYLVLGLCILSR